MHVWFNHVEAVFNFILLIQKKVDIKLQIVVYNPCVSHD